jgi:ubiquinone/menaquinone biosynthesis C-methylase UbiE
MTGTTAERRAIEAYYDEYATWYESERREGYYELVNDLEFGAVAGAVAGRDALEVGCGTGLLLERTAATARCATGVDLSGGMASFTRRRKGLVVAQASATALPFGDGSFDVVYSFKVLPHVPDLGATLAEIRRVLRPGGRAFVEVYNPWSLKRLANGVAGALGKGKPVYVRHDSLRQVRRVLPDGWDVKAVRGVRIFAPSKHAYTLPGLARAVPRLERRACDGPLGRLGGYLVLEVGPRG